MTRQAGTTTCASTRSGRFSLCSIPTVRESDFAYTIGLHDDARSCRLGPTDTGGRTPASTGCSACATAGCSSASSAR